MEEGFGKLKMGNWIGVAASAAAGVGLWLVFSRQMPPQIPLWYSQPWGDAQLASPSFLLMLPLLAVGLGLGVGGLTQKISGYKPLAAMTILLSLVTQLVLMLGMLRIILLVI